MEPGLKISSEEWINVMSEYNVPNCAALMERGSKFLHFFLWNELKTQLVQHPALANPAELRALLTRVYHRTWAGSREMFEKIGNAWVRRLKACVAAKGGFLE